MSRASLKRNWKALVEIVVADAGPLIALARLDLLTLPGQLFSRALLTPTVLAECLVKPDSGEGNLIQAALAAGHLQLTEAPQAAPDWSVDPGEASSIALATSQGYGLLIDDKAGRRLARHLGCSVLGTAGLLALAKRKGHLTTVRPLLSRLTESGYFLGDDVIDSVLRLCDE